VPADEGAGEGGGQVTPLDWFLMSLW
jgi:hypothetical protein